MKPCSFNTSNPHGVVNLANKSEQFADDHFRMFIIERIYSMLSMTNEKEGERYWLSRIFEDRYNDRKSNATKQTFKLNNIRSNFKRPQEDKKVQI